MPLPADALHAFEELKGDVLRSVVKVVDDQQPFTLETDASDGSIAGTLLQAGQPVAFFSRTLSHTESTNHIVEKEAQAIVECVRKWRHYLAGKHFTIITDQRGLSFMFDTTARGKIKNDKILRWRMELMPYSFDIRHRPGCENSVADALSRAHCGAVTDLKDLKSLHDCLVHPGVQRMWHFVRSKNLPYSMEEVRRMTSACQVCAKIKPRFYVPKDTSLIQATAPFHRISIDSKDHYLPRALTATC